MSKFSALVYRSPGPHRGPFGKSFDCCGVKSQEEMDAKLASGWFRTLADAVNPETKAVNAIKTKPADPELIQEEEYRPPTRAELEQKATELGIKFDGRTGDRRLLMLINAMLMPTVT